MRKPTLWRSLSLTGGPAHTKKDALALIQKARAEGLVAMSFPPIDEPLA
jgi:hypothetical protein